ncbi:Lipoma-preferred partner homolog [Eumeta japonica]|uniref:Lipoma-preferred partner homolog n=1 Tax=Eumeta variegata TaxID=151549 RepID=A0A4C1XPL2_EUMVA|nr:Lipoma-preferred partner homolog [Eumeta japonica]
MSQLDNLESLEKELANLQMVQESLPSSKSKKIPPAVPPKKKAQPQVPHSSAVNTLREPSYSSVLPSNNKTFLNNNNSLTYTQPLFKDYVNVNTIQSNLQKPQATYSQIRNNVPSLSSDHNINNKFLSTVPPPQHPANIGQSKYGSNHNIEEYAPPPSPVSSNYSELARATANINFNQDNVNYPPIYQNEYPVYGGSQMSTYESLYEPLNLSRNNVSGQENNSTMTSYRRNVPNSNNPILPKEREVDALTNILVQSISDSQELDVFGTCVKCKEKVIGETSGCTAMGNMYHVKCFTCHKCRINLQGKPFYAVDNQPYCEADYYESLEKCSVCNNPILDRILRATGKPYHPNCFTCVVCGKSLDGIPFTVDAMNQIHCIEDFHKKFAPRCCVCKLPIMPEEGQEETVRVVALDRSFHVRCYRCEDCALLLSSEAEGRGCYPLDGHILCKCCNAQRIRRLTNVMTTDL